jgi:hypothetical protein
MRRFAPAGPVAVGVLTLAVLVAGCSSNKKTPAAASAAPSSAAQASGSAAGSAAPALKGDPASIALLNQALVSLSKVKSVHLKGSFSEGSDSGNIDISFANGVGATGSVGIGGGTIKLLTVGKDIYIQGDAKSFAAIGGGTDLGALGGIAGKWLKLGSADASTFGDFSAFSDLSSFAKQFADVSGTVAPGGKKTINGQDSIGITDNAEDPSNSSTIYVAATGGHLPLAVVPAAGATSSTGPTTGEIDFLDYNAPVSVVAPTDAIDLSQLAQLGASPSS